MRDLGGRPSFDSCKRPGVCSAVNLFGRDSRGWLAILDNGSARLFQQIGDQGIEQIVACTEAFALSLVQLKRELRPTEMPLRWMCVCVVGRGRGGGRKKRIVNIKMGLAPNV